MTEPLGPSPETFVAWRIQTCQYLEKAFPPSSEAFLRHAQIFTRNCRALIGTLDGEMTAELAGLFGHFCGLAQRLWKLRTNIRVQELGDESLRKFEVMFAGMEAHPTVGLLHGDKRLDGRPICVVVRPRIVSEPIDAKPVRGGGMNGIVWSAAQVWVSSEDDLTQHHGST